MGLAKREKKERLAGVRKKKKMMESWVMKKREKTTLVRWTSAEGKLARKRLKKRSAKITPTTEGGEGGNQSPAKARRTEKRLSDGTFTKARWKRHLHFI